MSGLPIAPPNADTTVPPPPVPPVPNVGFPTGGPPNAPLAGKKAVHVKWAGKTIALGTFPHAEADEKCARAKALTRAWRSTMRPKPTREWVMLELERLQVRVVSGRLGKKGDEEEDDDDDDDSDDNDNMDKSKKAGSEGGKTIKKETDNGKQAKSVNDASRTTSLLNAADLVGKTDSKDRKSVV